jgi:nucleotide-binding universal stress UspA family protein
MPTLKALVPLDQSCRDRIMLPHVRRLAELTDVTIHLLHVIPTVKYLVPHAVRSAEAYVDAFEGQLKAQGVQAHGIVRRGDPAAEIVKVALEYEVDAIVMATRGRRGLDKFVVGSVAEAVMSQCACPVTLVNEATARGALDERVWAQSSYMAGIIWNKVARGLYSLQDAQTSIQKLEARGLDHDALKATFESLQRTGQPAEWLDLNFQLDTLNEFMPDDLFEPGTNVA